ncbi:ATP synthase F1 subunit delta [Brumimicrobium glaciale]|jgi:F-type H+-transporting ATPase subunit delta|uniref:ATP synthase subunit delta n=1 Tax=Brumimicrobium glaciale TaxID=200475 RepID=A0A4Q4KKW5_9FLAO|nr:ATP synthase F1 subunit delta [Brumimicrobium glaciale]RYM33962.1 ATP synthase F1 subunit delta [Brumimicrobium glaciale]
MEGLKVASRYAQSLIELADEKQVTDAVLKDMEYLLATTNDNRDFHVFLNSPLINADKKNNVFDKLFGEFQEISKKFIHLLTKNKREMILPIIAEEFVAKLNVIRGIVPMTLTSAVKLDETVKATILERLNKSIKGSIELTEKVDESLIGGFVVRMGDTRIDASIAHQLNEMKQRLIR